MGFQKQIRFKLGCGSLVRRGSSERTSADQREGQIVFGKENEKGDFMREDSRASLGTQRRGQSLPNQTQGRG